MTLLFLLSHQRSGSHFLKRTLNCHNEHLDRLQVAGVRYEALPEIFTPHSEVRFPELQDWLFSHFLRQRVSQTPETWGNPEGIAKATGLYLDHLDELAAGQVVLLDIKLNQLHIGEGWYHEVGSVPRLVAEFLKRGKVIFLRRRNLLRTIISGIQATNTGVWHVFDKPLDRPTQAQITVPVNDLLVWLSQLDTGLAAAEHWLDNWKSIVLKVDYEDLFDEKTYDCNVATFDRIAEFAGLTAGLPWQTTTKKIGKYQLSDLITNYQEVRAGLLLTKYAPMLDDFVAFEGERRVA